MCNLDNYSFAPTDTAVMVVPHYASGSSYDGTKRYFWTTSRGRGYNCDGTAWHEPDEAERIAKELTARNVQF